MIKSKLLTLFLLAFCLNFFVSCSSDDDQPDDRDIVVIDDNEDPVNVDSGDEDQGDGNQGDGNQGDGNQGDMDQDNTDTDQDNTDTDTDQDNTDDANADLLSRFIFDDTLVIENSYNTGGCESPPCDTDDESLANVFVNSEPNDPYFYLSEDESELNLECQLEKGRRIEFKQISRGPLTSSSKMEFEGVYYDIPNKGVTIAQVHNRGGNSNKPFFRLVLYKDGLETVIRKDPEVSSKDTTFSKKDFSFTGNEDYDLSSLKVVLEKNNGFVNISVENKGVILLDESYEPDPTTDWVNDTGIANGFYLKAGLYNDDGPHTKNLVLGYSTFIFTSND